MDFSNEEIVMVPVPRSLLPDVYAVLARGTRVRRYSEMSVEEPATLFESRAPYARSSTPGRSDSRRFSAGELGLLKRHLDPDGGARKLLDLCASRPGQMIRFDEVARETNFDPSLLKGQIGGLTKLLKKLFHDPAWPIHYTWGAQGLQQASYEMSDETAQMWLSIQP